MANGISRILIQARTAKGVPKTQTAKDLGVAYSTYFDWESGKRTPRNDKLFILAKYFDIPLAELRAQAQAQPSTPVKKVQAKSAPATTTPTPVPATTPATGSVTLDSKQLVLDILREQTTRLSQDMTPENVDAQEAELKKFIKIFKKISDLNFVATEHIVTDVPQVTEALPDNVSTHSAPVEDVEDTVTPTPVEKTIESETPTVAEVESPDKPEVTPAPDTPETEPVAATPVQTKLPVKTPTEPVKIAPEETDNDTPKAGWQAGHKVFIGRFRRGLSGGWVDKEIRIPEVILRQMNPPLENGDWVQAKLISDLTSSDKRYLFSLEKSDPQPTDIREITFKPVRYRSDIRRFEVEFKSDRHELPVTIVFKDTDILKNRISTGDYVDLAYYEGKESDARIRWKYSAAEAAKKRQAIFFQKKPASETTTTTPTPTVQKPAPKKIKKKGPTKQKIFADKVFLLVGGYMKSVGNKFKSVIEERGGSFMHYDKKNQSNSLRRDIDNADFIVVYTPEVSHQQMWVAKDYSKVKDKPIYFAKTSTEINLLQSYKRSDLFRDRNIASEI
ncbi:MAG: DUF2325 domain-containing protein [Lactobacillus sp.]|jgi:transcriptional regulator with XRE-family HTH domain|nr:DUF2325 domain-containing protein [Lactobacillus sp.]